MTNDPHELAADPPELREQLAAIEHERWAHWQRYMHNLCERTDDGRLIIPAASVARWERQIATSYADLTEIEKNGDREQVDRYWPLVKPHLRIVEDHPSGTSADPPGLAEATKAGEAAFMSGDVYFATRRGLVGAIVRAAAPILTRAALLAEAAAWEADGRRFAARLLRERADRIGGGQ